MIETNMSRQETTDQLYEMNAALLSRLDSGEPIMMRVNNRPDIRIHSYDPMQWETYGYFRNRAPHLAGSMALRGLLVRDDQYSDTGVEVFCGLVVGRQDYGFRLSSPTTPNNIAVNLGYFHANFKAAF